MARAVGIACSEGTRYQRQGRIDQRLPVACPGATLPSMPYAGCVRAGTPKTVYWFPTRAWSACWAA